MSEVRILGGWVFLTSEVLILEGWACPYTRGGVSYERCTPVGEGSRERARQEPPVRRVNPKPQTLNPEPQTPNSQA